MVDWERVPHVLHLQSRWAIQSYVVPTTPGRPMRRMRGEAGKRVVGNDGKGLRERELHVAVRHGLLRERIWDVLELS